MTSLFDNLPMVPRPARGATAFSETAGAPGVSPLYRIVLVGDPVAKARPRGRIVWPKGKEPFIHFYQQKETEEYEERLRIEASKIIKGNLPIDGLPIGLLVRVYITIPDSWSQKKKCSALRGEILPLSRPDHDNYLKMASDALNGIIYRDDALITDSHQVKRYSDRPRIEIEVFV